MFIRSFSKDISSIQAYLSFDIEPVRDKTNSLSFRPGPTQTGLYSYISSLET